MTGMLDFLKMGDKFSAPNPYLNHMFTSINPSGYVLSMHKVRFAVPMEIYFRRKTVSLRVDEI